MSADDKFFLGKMFDLEKDELSDDIFHYDPDDLTTHGVVVGMTGSGKTGLSIDLLEEAALQGIPAIIIDPKGDLSNLLLQFPELSPASFEPWVPAADGRNGKSRAEVASETAQLWQDGLSRWGMDADRITRLTDSVEFALYTPGAESVRPVNVLTALAAPAAGWDESPERFRDKIEATATSLLALVQRDADPVQSRDHILLSNLLETAWKGGSQMTLEEMIQQIQNPPFERLGALELDKFFPEDDRFGLATALNSLLAAPSFSPWTVGDELNVERILWTSEGKPRHAVFYLAHLSDDERMFFVTLLLSAVETWMRGQSGSDRLRAIVYMDEVFGYLPPTAVPPSKRIFIRLLKQARAFGIGLLLATQNPVDLDYKALTNAGTWFIGRLQTERDKARLLDGLQAADAGEGLKRSEADRAISNLPKRVFLVHNVHAESAAFFQTRWAMAYLAGPLSLKQLEGLAGERRVERQAQRSGDTATTSTKPALPDSIPDRYWPAEGAADGRKLVYVPALGAVGAVRYVQSKDEIDHQQHDSLVLLEPDTDGLVPWAELDAQELGLADLATVPAGSARYEAVGAPLSEARQMSAMRKAYADHLYRDRELRLPANEPLELIAGVGESAEAFAGRCAAAAAEARDQAAAKLKAKFDKQMASMKKKLSAEERELAEDMAEHSSRRMEEWVTHAENLLGLLSGSRSRRRVSTSLSKRRMTRRAKDDIAESEEIIAAFRRDLEALEDELAEALDDLDDTWAEIAESRTEAVITPRRKDVQVEFFGVIWLPYWEGTDERSAAFDEQILA